MEVRTSSDGFSVCDNNRDEHFYYLIHPQQNSIAVMWGKYVLIWNTKGSELVFQTAGKDYMVFQKARTFTRPTESIIGNMLRITKAAIEEYKKDEKYNAHLEPVLNNFKGRVSDFHETLRKQMETV